MAGRLKDLTVNGQVPLVKTNMRVWMTAPLNLTTITQQLTLLLKKF